MHSFPVDCILLFFFVVLAVMRSRSAARRWRQVGGVHERARAHDLLVKSAWTVSRASFLNLKTKKKKSDQNVSEGTP